MSAVAVAIGSFAAGSVFGAYWARRGDGGTIFAKRGAAEPAHVSTELQWLYDSRDHRSEADPFIREARVVYLRSPEPVYRLAEGA